MYKRLLFFIFLIPVSLNVFSQYNYNAGWGVVYNILNTNCSNAGCHSATSAQSLRFDTTSAAVHAEIYNQPPMNISALNRGERLVWMDQPYQSYLLKKAGSWFDSDLGLPVGESDSAAHSQASTGLTNIQVEYIRQWIMNSASDTGQTLDTTIINSYYNDTTSGPFSPKLAKPSANTGIQWRYGPIFLRNAPGHNQGEYMLMNQINFPSDQEVTGLNVAMTSFSHHFILFTFNDSASAAAKAVGFRSVQLSLGNTVSPFDGNKAVASAWVFSQDIELPTQTAFFWPKTTYIDLDFHMLNYSTYAILPFDVYINIAATPRNVNDNIIQMKAHLNNNTSLGAIDLNPPYYLNLIPPHATSRCIDEDQNNGSDTTRYLWMLNSHTHKMGVAFNIYNFDPSQPNDLGKDTIYNGFMTYNNFSGVVNQGYYDWEHPPIEFFPNLLPVNFRTSGLIAETVYKNGSSSYQTFGFTTAQEMQLFYYLYTSEVPAALGLKNINKTTFDFSIYPNPMAGTGTISYTLSSPSTVNASVLDITGKEIATLKDDKEQAGSYTINISQDKALSAGMYFAKLTVNRETITKKFVVE